MDLKPDSSSRISNFPEYLISSMKWSDRITMLAVLSPRLNLSFPDQEKYIRRLTRQNAIKKKMSFIINPFDDKGCQKIYEAYPIKSFLLFGKIVVGSEARRQAESQDSQRMQAKGPDQGHQGDACTDGCQHAKPLENIIFIFFLVRLK